jgi:SAM-dependent methyltransferase
VLKSKHYDQQAGEDYFDFQAAIGEFGGWANVTKFWDYISPDDTVLDFGCGGGYLLKNLACARRVGVEVNPAAAQVAKDNDVEVYLNTDDVSDNSIDVIVSNNALEHTLQPLDELKRLLPKLRDTGRLIFVVPCESIHYEYKPRDINHHLYSWSPMCLGNLLTEAGYDLEESRPYIHKWPKRYRKLPSYLEEMVLNWLAASRARWIESGFRCVPSHARKVTWKAKMQLDFTFFRRRF